MKEMKATIGSAKRQSTKRGYKSLNKNDEDQLVKSKEAISKMHAPCERISIAETESNNEGEVLASYKRRMHIHNLLIQSSISLKVQANKLEQECFHLKERESILFETCKVALKEKKKDNATQGASEIAELRKIIQLFYITRLAITRVLLRIEENNETFTHIKPAVKLLEASSQEIVHLLPDVSKELNNECKVLLAICNQ
jgi:division protein CdvB (Snf7/Vps24/ESCRT-III family)